MGVHSSRISIDRWRLEPARTGPIEARTTLPEQRKMEWKTDRLREMGTTINQTPCTSRRGDRVRILLVAEKLRSRKTARPRILHARQWRKQSLRPPSARHDGRHHEHQLQHQRNARTNR